MKRNHTGSGEVVGSATTSFFYVGMTVAEPSASAFSVSNS